MKKHLYFSFNRKENNGLINLELNPCQEADDGAECMQTGSLEAGC